MIMLMITVRMTMEMEDDLLVSRHSLCAILLFLMLFDDGEK